MFGLSIKEKHKKEFMRLCEEKLKDFEKEIRSVIRRAESMRWQEAEEAYATALQHYTSAITEEIHMGLPLNAGLRYGTAMLQPSISGLP